MKKLLVFISLLGFIGCAPTKITKTWRAEDALAKKYKKVLVLSVLPESEKDLGVSIENHLADDLRGMGYLAIAANKIFPYGTFVKGDTTRAAKAIEGKGFDGIMTIVLLDKKKEPYYVPGKITDYSNFDKYSRFDRYYNTVAENIYAPGYYGEETKYIWENNFYDLTTRERIYSARTRSFDFTSKNTLAHTYGMLMAQSLIKNNILQKPEYMTE
ncbi:MAG TPA: hypothetical protein PKC72_14775 [Chitinophagaceae bacterium]|nr:hypothetical protein [Chitinophagaceae bacterium]